MLKHKTEPSVKKSLMIVDDDELDRSFFRSAIRKNNPTFECIEAKNGDDALKQLRSASTLPDFIFLDLNMPKMDGRECLIELKKDPSLKHIPVIMYSSTEYRMNTMLIDDLGADYFLTKLTDIYSLPEELVKAMEKVNRT